MKSERKRVAEEIALRKQQYGELPSKTRCLSYSVEGEALQAPFRQYEERWPNFGIYGYFGAASAIG